MPRRKPAHLAPVATRRVVHISGFEPVSPERLNRRMTSGLSKFAKLWNATVTCSEPDLSADGRSIHWSVDTVGPDWQTRCDYTVLRWDELMAPYVERSWPKRMLGGFGALFEFIRTGTLRRYFKANVRYGLFTLYPLIAFVGFLLAGILVGILVAALGAPMPWLTGTLVAAIVFLLLLRFVGGYMHLDFALADWSFAADVARRDVPGLEEMINQYAGVVVEAIRDPAADEVLLSSVSLGSMMLVEALSHAYERNPGLDRESDRAAFLTVGSSILKIGLHPAAKALRRRVYRVGAERSLFWVEYQAKVDPINFYKTDPVADLGNPKTGRPIVKLVRIRDMMDPQAYRRAQRKLLYLHRQFVMPNGRRYAYDFYQISFGPLGLKDRVALGARAASIAFGKDGRFKRKRSGGKRNRPRLENDDS